MNLSVSPLYFLAFTAFFIVFMVIVYKVGFWQWKSTAADARARKAGPLYIGLLVLTFGAGALARTIQQMTRSEWADALVPIFGGLFTLALVWPLVFLPRQHPLPFRKQVIGWVVAALLSLLAILFFFMGLRQLLGIAL